MVKETKLVKILGDGRVAWPDGGYIAASKWEVTRCVGRDLEIRRCRVIVKLGSLFWHGDVDESAIAVPSFEVPVTVERERRSR